MTTHSNCLFCLFCKLIVTAMTLFPLTVKIQMRIDCETIPDPHSRLETSGTLVTDSQGTQACYDELVVTCNFPQHSHLKALAKSRRDWF